MFRNKRHDGAVFSVSIAKGQPAGKEFVASWVFKGTCEMQSSILLICLPPPLQWVGYCLTRPLFSPQCKRKCRVGVKTRRIYKLTNYKLLLLSSMLMCRASELRRPASSLSGDSIKLTFFVWNSKNNTGV